MQRIAGVRIQAAFAPEFYRGVRNPDTGHWEPADTSGIYAETGFDLQARFLPKLIWRAYQQVKLTE
ncbi:MAG: hypothetical protein M3069_29905 [Chloroflexota bacterium]|nr:hypothetical protein [Chloroflexota bacterium]